jgi:hypothetical protein
MNYKEAFYGFIKITVVTTLIVVVTSVIIFTNISPWLYPPVFPFLLAFFVAATLLVYHFMLKSLEKRPARFVNVFLLTTMLKLLVYMIFMVIYALLNREYARPFIVSFFLLYIIYTVIEVVSILKVNKLVGNYNARAGRN